MYRWFVGLCIIVLSVPFGIAYGIKTGEVEIGQNGIYDGVVKIGRDAAGNLLFQDSQVTTPVLLKDLGQGVEHHNELQGLSGDDHLHYLTSGRHGQAHMASFNDALAVSPDVGNNTTLGSHVQDSDIHLQRGEAEQISGNWVFSGATQFYAPVHFSNNGGTGSQSLEFEAGAEDAKIEWNATSQRFELNKGLSAPVSEFALGKATEMEVGESLSGRDGSGNPVAVIEGFSQIEGIQAQNLLDKSADEDVNGQWDFLKNMRVTQTLSSLSSYLWAMTAELTSTSNDTQNRSGLNRAGLMASSHFSNQGSGDVTYSWNVGVQGEGRSTGKSASGESINDFGVVGKASSESALTNVVGVAGFGDLYSTNRSRIGVYGGLDSSVMSDPESLPTGEWAGYFAGNVHATGTLSGDGSGLSGVELLKGQVVTVAKSHGDFASIQDAIDSITDAGPTKPYVVLVYPGIYNEQVHLSKGYVSLIGIQANGTKWQNSGTIITYASSGQGDDLMTMHIASGGTTDLKGITIANLTIRNTQSLGVGPEQAALDIGRGDVYPRSHEVLIKNCSLYGEQDTVFVNTGNPVFQDCYIEGENDISSVADDSLFYRVHFYCHTDHGARHPLWLGRSDNSAFTVTFYECVFDKKVPQTSAGGVGYFAHQNVTANFYHCTLMPNLCFFAWDFNNQAGCTVNLYATNGWRWRQNKPANSYINYQEQCQLYIQQAGGEPSAIIKNVWDNEVGPRIFLYKNRSNTAQANDEAGMIRFHAENAADEDTVAAELTVIMTDVTDGTEDGEVQLSVMENGTAGTKFKFKNDGTLTFKNAETIDNNTDGLITITGNGQVTGSLTVDTNTLYVDAPNNRVGIGTTSPDTYLHVKNGTTNIMGVHSAGATNNYVTVGGVATLQVVGSVAYFGSNASGGSYLGANNYPVALGADPGTSQAFLVSSQLSNRAGVVVKGVASQSADLQQWQDSNANVLASIDKDGNITASGKKVTAKLFDVTNYTGGLPTASSTYRGCLAFVEGGTGVSDTLYVCIKNTGGGYEWKKIADETTP